jgi:superfamily II DNA helicase RecQ
MSGYDYHLVEDVIFFEIGYGLFNLVQGGGRGGRSGKKANVILLTNDWVHTCHQNLDPAEDMELLELMAQWAHNTKLCRRWIISDAMDSQPTTCAKLAGAQLCDICQPDSQITGLLREAVELAEKPRAATMLLFQTSSISILDPVRLADHTVMIWTIWILKMIASSLIWI